MRGDSGEKVGPSYRESTFLVALLFLLTLLDGHFTFLHLSGGAREFNPLLAYVLEQWGPAAFPWIKYSITLPCLFILRAYAHLPLTQKGIRFLTGVYAGLTLYHLWGFTVT